MKKFFFLLTGAALMFAGCAKVENENTQVVPEKGTHPVTLQATINNADTRVSADNNGVFAWQETDQISVITKYGSLEGELVFSNGITITDNKATFTFNLNGGQTLGQYAFYPAAEGCMVDSDGFIWFGLRHQLDYAPGVTNMPMLGTLSPNGASFAPVGGVIKLTVANVPSEANYLRFSVPGKKIAGTFLVENGAIAAEDYDANDLQAYNYVDILIHSGSWASTMEFYIPVPTGNLGNPTFAFYKTGQTDPLFAVTPSIQGGLEIERKDIIVPPTLNALKKGAEWSYTFTSKTYNANGSETLNGKSWTLAGDEGYLGFDNNQGRGHQFGSGGNPYHSLTLSSNFGQDYGVKDITINASGASGATATVSISVGGVAFKCGNESFVSLTTSATEYTFTTPNGQLVAGDIVISYSQPSTSKALYLKSIAVNPDVSTPLAVVQLSALQDGGTKNVIASWTGVDHAASYTVALGDQSASIQLAPDNQYQHSFTVDSFGDYVVTVTANPESGYKASVATANVSVLDHTPRITLNTNSITDVDAQGWNAHTVEGVYTLNDFAADTDISVSVDGTVVTAASVSNGSVILTVAANTGTSPRNGSFTLRFSGEDFMVQVSQKGTGGSYETTYTSNVKLSTSGGTNATSATVKIGGISYDAIKAGTSGSGGVVKVTVPANKTVLHVHVAAWNGDSPSIGLTVPSVNSISPNSLSPASDSGLNGTGSTFTLSGDASSYYVKLTLSGASSETRQVTFTSSGNKKRFVIWGVNAE